MSIIIPEAKNDITAKRLLKPTDLSSLYYFTNGIADKPGAFRSADAQI